MREWTRRLLDGLDRIAPEPEGATDEARRRVRLIVAAGLLGTLILGVTGLTSLVMGLDPKVTALNFAWAVAIGGLIVGGRHVLSAVGIANALASFAFAHTLLLSLLAGGRNVGAMFSFAVFPIVAVLLSGWRSGLVFTALSATAVVLSPWVPGEWLAPEYARLAPPSTELIRDALNVVFAVGLLSALYDAARSLTVRDAERSAQRARRAAEHRRRLLQLSGELQTAQGASFDDALSAAMEQAAAIAESDRTILRLIDRNGMVGRFTFGEDDEVPAEIASDVATASGRFSWTAQRIAAREVSQFARLEDFPPEAAAERAYLASRGVRSWLCIPVRAGNQFVGYQSFETTNTERTWSEDDIDSLRLMTELLAGAVLRRRAERALGDSEAKFSLAFQEHPDAMVISDLETDEIVECNDEWLRMTASPTRTDVVGRKLWDFGFDLPEDIQEQIRSSIRDVGHRAAMEIPIQDPAGRHRTFLLSASRINILGRACILSNVHDLTESKDLEQRLLQAQKMEAVGRLAGGIAHDYNNMLTVISAYSAGLVEELDGELQRDANEILLAARRSADLTRQLLTFSRRQALHTDVVDVNDLVNGLKTMLTTVVGPSVELTIDLTRGPLLVDTDASQMEQAIVNLVLNARDAVSGTGSIAVQSRAVDGRAGGAGLPSDLAPGDYVRISVSDNGTGISPEVTEHALEPFFTTKPEGEGTGLGLSTALGLAQQCRGTLVLEGRREGGTRASIYLPVSLDDVVEASPEQGETSRSRALSSACILLVDDEPAVRRVGARALRAAGHDVIEAEDGEAAWNLLTADSHEIDMIVSDVAMPTLSGVELCQRVRAQSPDIGLLLVSGYSAGVDRSELPDDVSLLEKPYDAETLCKRVNEVVRAKTEPPA